MFSPARFFLVTALLFALVGATPGLEQPVLAQTPAAADRQEYPNDPLETNLPVMAASTTSGQRTINAPYFPVANVTGEKFAEMAIFWFGKVGTNENYTDVRVGYNDAALYINASVFDKYTWYDPSHNPAKITAYDGISLFLNTGGTTTYPNQNTYRFDAQFSGYEGRNGYQIAYRGTGSAFKRDDAILFTSERGYAGSNFNNGKENRGWAMTFVIPFSSLGLSGKPADLSAWGMGLAMHDRDGRSTSALHRYWPESTTQPARPKTYGRLVFGLPSYTPPPAAPGGTVTVRHRLNGALVPDAAVGGTVGNLCNATNLWTKWGAKNFGKGSSFMIQNQSNLHDWPCFSKYYVNFPLGQVPKGKVITSARLVLHIMGGSDWTQAYPSLIQVSTVKTNWSASTLTWNNAPRAQENVSQTWVNPVDHAPSPDEWPGWPYEWDVTRAAAEAYQAGLPLRLAMYEADSEMHSGKQFTTSDVEDWNAAGRPTLIIEWGQPQ